MKRFLVFDRLRVVALLMILSCHFTRSVNAASVDGTRIDLVLGAVGNFIFFVLSGWLLGLSWQNKGSGGLGMKWLLHRIMRLSVPLWLFLIPYFAYLHFTGTHIGFHKVLLNLLLLNWFARVPGTTPYWFITAIVVFYVLIVAVSNIRRLNEKRSHLLLIALTVTLVAQFALSLLGIRQGYLLTLLVCGLAMFLYARKILDGVNALAKTWYSGVFVTGGQC